VNKLIIIGYVGREPELRITPAGESVCSFTLADNRKYKTQGGEDREQTNWFNCTAWGKLAEIVNEHVVKGQQLYCEGSVQLRTYQRQDGTMGASLDVLLQSVQFLGSKEAGETGAGERVPEEAAA